VAFQDTFWIVAGGAAPVIALASVVTFSEARQLEAISQVEVRAQVLEMPLSIRNDFWKARNRLLHLAQLMAWVQILNLALQCWILASSLLSLAQSANELPTSVVVGVEVAGIALLAVGGFGAARFKYRRSIFAYQIEAQPPQSGA
jgi:hypothetical protein